MRVCTVLGTRPEIIRLSLVIPLLDRHCEHVLIHTGQNYDERLDRIFFGELGLRKPDYHFQSTGSTWGDRVGGIIAQCEAVFANERPDRVLILGDTNSGLSAITARRLGVPVYHMEAGNRCYDDRVPEELNRRLIDHASTVLLPYTERSRANLLREGIASDRIVVTGNPIRQVVEHYRQGLPLEIAYQHRGFFLATLHRAETVDVPERLTGVARGLSRVHAEHGLPVVWPLHPRTKDRAESDGVTLELPGIQIVPPMGFAEFVALERSAACVLTDSGTVQEEACLFGVPSVTLRDVTERPELLECGSGILAGTDPDRICAAVRAALALPTNWTPPPEYLRTDVAETVCKLLVA